MIDRAPKTRQRRQQAPRRTQLRDSLTFNDRLITLGEALERPRLPGLYTLTAESNGVTYLCVVMADGLTAVPLASKVPRQRRTRPAPPKVKTLAELRAQSPAMLRRAAMLVDALAALGSGK